MNDDFCKCTKSFPVINRLKHSRGRANMDELIFSILIIIQKNKRQTQEIYYSLTKNKLNSQVTENRSDKSNR